MLQLYKLVVFGFWVFVVILDREALIYSFTNEKFDTHTLGLEPMSFSAYFTPIAIVVMSWGLLITKRRCSSILPNIAQSLFSFGQCKRACEFGLQ